MVTVDMNSTDMDSTVRDVVAAQLSLDPDHLTIDRHLAELGLDDDACAFAVLGAVEDVLEVRFPDDFLDGVHTFGQLTSAVRVAVGS